MKSVEKPLAGRALKKLIGRIGDLELTDKKVLHNLAVVELRKEWVVYFRPVNQPEIKQAAPLGRIASFREYGTTWTSQKSETIHEAGNKKQEK